MIIKTEPQTIFIRRQEPNFDKACELAYDEAVRAFEVDENGHFPKPLDEAGFQRSCATIIVALKGIKMSTEICYKFSAWVEAIIEEDDE